MASPPTTWLTLTSLPLTRQTLGVLLLLCLLLASRTQGPRTWATTAVAFHSTHTKIHKPTHPPTPHNRIELFKPTYVLGPRPAWASVPTSAEFGATFTITLAANTTVADIVGVVMTDPGTATHSSTMSTRTMDLAFVPAGGQSLTVTAPANIHVAQPGFYLLFAVARDGSYSVGKWIRIKGPWGSRPYSLPAPTQFVAAASSHFELNFSECLSEDGGGWVAGWVGGRVEVEP